MTDIDIKTSLQIQRQSIRKDYNFVINHRKHRDNQDVEMGDNNNINKISKMEIDTESKEEQVYEKIEKEIDNIHKRRNSKIKCKIYYYCKLGKTITKWIIT